MATLQIKKNDYPLNHQSVLENMDVHFYYLACAIMSVEEFKSAGESNIDAEGVKKALSFEMEKTEHEIS